MAEGWLDLIGRHHDAIGLLLVGLSACIEYLFPPFPGDMVTVFGAFLVARRGWSGPGVYGAVLVGSVVGLLIDYGVGRRLARRERWPGRLERARPAIERLVERFRRHGALYLVINRFIPSLRALFFVAAGMAELPAGRVLLCGLASAIVWNGLLFTLGITAGEHWERARTFVDAEGRIALAAIAVVALLWLLRARRRRANDRERG